MKTEMLGWNELEETLKSLPNNLARNVLRGGVRAAAKAYLQDVKELVPVGDGDLRDSLIIREDKMTADSVTYAVGTTKKGFYGHMVEFGTVRMRAKPFMRPPFDENHGKYIAIMGEAMAKSLARQAKRAAGKFGKSGF